LKSASNTKQSLFTSFRKQHVQREKSFERQVENWKRDYSFWKQAPTFVEIKGEHYKTAAALRWFQGDPLKDLALLCFDFITEEASAFAEMYRDRGIAPTHSVAVFDAYTKNLLRSVREAVWDTLSEPGIVREWEEVRELVTYQVKRKIVPIMTNGHEGFSSEGSVYDEQLELTISRMRLARQREGGRKGGKENGRRNVDRDRRIRRSALLMREEGEPEREIRAKLANEFDRTPQRIGQILAAKKN
jgi:hypothetical protein